MLVYSPLVVAYFEQLSSDPGSGATTGRFYLNTTSHVVKWYANSAWHTAMDLDTAQTATNKTFTSPVLTTPNVDDYIDMNEESAPSTPSAGKLRFYAGTDQKLYTKDSNGVVQEVGSGAGGAGEKNYIDNPSAASAITGWSNVGDLDVARTTTAGDLPREYTTGTGIKITADSNTQSTADYVYYDFTLDDVDLNKKLKIQWSQKQTGSYVASDLAVVITTQADRTTALHTPETTNIGAFDGVFQTTFDSGSTATLSLVIRATADMATDAGIVISDVIVGPGTVQIVPAIGTWQSYTSTLTGFAATPTQSLFYKRNNDSISIRGSITVAGANSGNISFTIPSGLTINTSRLGNGVDGGSAYWQVGSATVKDDNTNVLYSGTILTNNTSTNDLVFVTPDGSGAASLWGAAEPIATWAASDTIEIEITDIAINEWAGAPNYAGQNSEVYVATNGTWDADDTTLANLVYGPAGAITGGTLTANRTKRVRGPAGYIPDIQLQIASGSGWVSASQVLPRNRENTAESGVTIAGVSGSTTDYDVTFRQYQILNGGTFGAAGSNWPSTYYWRVVFVRPGAAVGFSLADTSGRAGLVAPYTEGTGVVYSGTYTPTISNLTNGSSATARQHNYMRVGKIVFVSGRVDFTLTTTLTDTTFDLTLPVSTGNFPDAYQATGSGMMHRSASAVRDAALVYSVSSSQTVQVFIEYASAPNGTGVQAYYSFSYEIQ